MLLILGVPLGVYCAAYETKPEPVVQSPKNDKYDKTGSGRRAASPPLSRLKPPPSAPRK